MTNKEKYDMEAIGMLKDFVFSKDESIKIIDLFHISKRYKNKFELDIIISADINEWLSRYFYLSGFDKYIFSLMLMLLFNEDTKLNEIFVNKNVKSNNTDYYCKIEAKLFEQFIAFKDSIINDLIFEKYFYKIQITKTEYNNNSQEINPGYFKNLLNSYPFQNVAAIEMYINNNELTDCFECIYSCINQDAFEKLYPAIITLWINSIRFRKLSDKDLLFESDFFTISNISTHKQEWTRSDLFLMSLFLNDGSYNRNSVTTWEGRIEKKIYNKCKAIKRQEYRTNIDHNYKKLMTDEELIYDPEIKNNSNKAIPENFKYNKLEFWNMIFDLYNSGIEYENKLDKMIGSQNIRFFQNLFLDKQNLFKNSSNNSLNKNSFASKSLSLFYINQVTKWPDLLFTVMGLPLEACVIDGFAIKNCIYNMICDKKSIFGHRGEFNYNIFITSELLNDVFIDFSRRYRNIFESVNKSMDMYFKTAQYKSVEKLYDNIFDNLFNDIIIKKIRSFHVLNLAYYVYRNNKV